MPTADLGAPTVTSLADDLMHELRRLNASVKWQVEKGETDSICTLCHADRQVAKLTRNGPRSISLTVTGTGIRVSSRPTTVEQAITFTCVTLNLKLK